MNPGSIKTPPRPGRCESEAEEILRPLSSLLSKSAKAQQKLAAGTWQHAMLQKNVQALRTATALMNTCAGARPAVTRTELTEALPALTAMIGKTEKALASFAPGTAQHTLQRNRLRALRRARVRIKAAMRSPPSQRSPGRRPAVRPGHHVLRKLTRLLSIVLVLLAGSGWADPVHITYRASLTTTRDGRKVLTVKDRSEDAYVAKYGRKFFPTADTLAQSARWPVGTWLTEKHDWGNTADNNFHYALEILTNGSTTLSEALYLPTSPPTGSNVLVRTLVLTGSWAMNASNSLTLNFSEVNEFAFNAAPGEVGQNITNGPCLNVELHTACGSSWGTGLDGRLTVGSTIKDYSGLNDTYYKSSVTYLRRSAQGDVYSASVRVAHGEYDVIEFTKEIVFAGEVILLHRDDGGAIMLAPLMMSDL